MWVVSGRYSDARLYANFHTRSGDYALHDKVIFRTDRGTEVGEILSAPAPLADDDPQAKFTGEILRRMTPEDIDELLRLQDEVQQEEYQFCHQKIQELALKMRLSSVEQLFGGEKIIFYFVSDGRVDFRELVKELARKYRTRIEMRQVGLRDEARLLGDWADCGRELCCKTHLREFAPITMKMAKMQKSTLDLAKISGQCGRLKCCLKYEEENYTALAKLLPKKGSWVSTRQGRGQVRGIEILAQQIVLEKENGEILRVRKDDIVEVHEAPAAEHPEPEDTGGRELEGN